MFHPYPVSAILTENWINHQHLVLVGPITTLQLGLTQQSFFITPYFYAITLEIFPKHYYHYDKRCKNQINLNQSSEGGLTFNCHLIGRLWGLLYIRHKTNKGVKVLMFTFRIQKRVVNIRKWKQDEYSSVARGWYRTPTVTTISCVYQEKWSSSEYNILVVFSFLHQPFIQHLLCFSSLGYP